MDRASISLAFDKSLAPALDPANDELEYLLCAGLFGNAMPRHAPWETYGAACKAQAQRIVARKDAAPIVGYFLGSRVRTAVTAVTALFLDFDEVGAGGGPAGVVDSLRAALDSLDAAYSLSESCSSAPGAERWHLVLPLAEHVAFHSDTAAHGARWARWSLEYVAVADAVCALAGIQAREWDPMCKNANRIRYVGSRLSEDAAARQVHHRSGRRLRWDALVAELSAGGALRANATAPGNAQAPSAGAASPTSWSAPKSGAWPSERAFSRADYEESHERCLLYLSSPRCPVSVSGQRGDEVAYQVAIKVLRGFPLCGPARLAAMESGDKAPVDAADAMHEAYELLRRVWNPRCLGEDGETQFQWDTDRLAYKVEQAAEAERLPGPDYWIFDEPAPRAKWAKRQAASVEDAATKAPAVQVVGHDEGGNGRSADANVCASAISYDWFEGPSTEDAVADKLAAEQARYLAEGTAMAGPEAFRNLGDVGLPANPDAATRLAAKVVPPVEIEVTIDWNGMADKALIALRNHPIVYTWEGKLSVRQKNHDPSRAPVLYPIKRGNLMDILSNPKYAKWYTKDFNKGGEEIGETPTKPDKDAIRVLHERPYLEGVRRVKAIVSTPVLIQEKLTKEHRILQRPGHDAETDMLYNPPPGPGLDPVSERPSRDDCRAALGALFDVVRDFPFEEPRKAFGVWLAAVLTRFCRYAFDGNIPLFAVSATMASSGKGKLRDAAAIITDGVQSSVTGFDAGNEGETERKIGMEILNGERHVCIDNIPEGVKLASPTLEAMLTSTNFSTRKVGTSEKIKSSLTETIPWATGNNMELGGDLWRRTVVIHIADRTGCPDARRTSKPELESWCHKERRRLVHAALTLVSGYVAAGMPKPDLPPMASFEGWGLVRQIVVWCGLPDPILSRGEVTDDDDVAVRANLFAALRTAMGDDKWTVKALGQELESDAGRKKHAKLAAILKEAHVKIGDAVGTYLHAKHQNKSVKMPNGEVWTLNYKRSANARAWWISVDVPSRDGDESAEKTAKKGQKRAVSGN